MMDRKINYSNKLLINFMRRPQNRISLLRNNKFYKNSIKMYENPSLLCEVIGSKRNYKELLDKQMEEIDNLKDQANYTNMIIEKKNKIIDDKNLRIKELSDYAQKQSEKLSEVVKNNLRLSEENFDYKKKISYLEELLKNISIDKNNNYNDKKHDIRSNKCDLKENANLLQELNNNISKLNLNLSSMRINDKDDESIDSNINKDFDDGVSSDSDVIIVGYKNTDKKAKLL